MKKIIESMKDFFYYLIFDKFSLAEYMVSVVDACDDTKRIMETCPWEFTTEEKVKLFLFRFGRKGICIFISGFLWSCGFQQIAEEWFFAFNLPDFLLPFCLFVALDKLTKSFDDLGFRM